MEFKNFCDSDVYLLASMNGHLEIMKYLENEHNWDIHIKNNFDNDAYLTASWTGHLEIMKYLEKEHNWDIHIKNNIGNDAYNLELSQKRAESVVQYLIKHGVFPARLIAKGYGSSQPNFTNDTEEGRLKNRRTEFKVIE